MKYSFVTAIASLLVLSSCSWYRDMERSLIEDDEKQAKKSHRGPVSREQYDQLLVKYEELSKKYEEIKENPNANKVSLVDELQKTQSENFANASANAESETVNLFTNNEKSTAEVGGSLEAQVNLYRRALAMKASNPGEATKLFQQLDAEGAPAVSTRAKFQTGELLFSQQQFDLALQVFEDIINKSAHSGVVLDALKYAAACSDKLGLASKKDQYTSLLKDVFEIN